MKRKARKAEIMGNAGVISVHLNKLTDDYTTVYLSEAQQIDPDDGGKYLLVCEVHCTTLNHTNKRISQSLASHPEEWCAECRKLTGEEITELGTPVANPK